MGFVGHGQPRGVTRGPAGLQREVSSSAAAVPGKCEGDSAEPGEVSFNHGRVDRKIR